MAGAHQPLRHRPVQPSEDASGRREIDTGHARAQSSLEQQAMRPAQLATCQPEQVQPVAGRFQIAARDGGQRWNECQRRDQQRSRDGYAPPLGIAIFVVERVLARDKRDAPCDGGIMAAGRRAQEAAEPVRLTRVAPAEVIQERASVGVAASGDDVAQRLVAGRERHPVGVDQAVARVDATADGDGAIMPAARLQHRRVGRRVARDTAEWSLKCAPLNQVVIGARNRLTAADIRVPE